MIWEYFIWFAIGVGTFIGIYSLRSKEEARWQSAYWFIYGLLGIGIVINQDYGVLSCLILLSKALRLTIRALFCIPNDEKPLVLGILVAVILSFFYAYSEYALYLIFTYLVIDTYFLIRMVDGLFRVKGVQWWGNAGKRITWLKLFIFMSALLMLLIASNIGDDYAKYVSAVYGLIALLGISKYTAPDGLKPVVSKEKYVKSRLDVQEKHHILVAIDRLIGIEKVHLHSDVSLKSMSKQIGTSSHILSQVLNESKGMSFFEFIAYHRIQSAKKLLKNEQYHHYKIEEIAERVGYLSKSSFNTSFKKITGKTPSEFREDSVRTYKNERREHRGISQTRESTRTFEEIKNAFGMLTNFFKIYLRNQFRNPVFSLINTLGLIIGLACCMLIGIYLDHELSYDQFHEDAGDIYRLVWMSDNGQTRTQHPLSTSLVEDFAQVQSAVSLSPIYGAGLTLQRIYVRNPANNIMFQEPDAFFADSTFFDVFDFELLSGDPATALNGVGHIVISEKLSSKYFGDENPLGKFIELVEFDLKGVVTGVMQTPPRNSHFHPQLMVSYMTVKSVNPNNPWFSWDDPGHFNYIKLTKGASAKEIERAIPDWLQNYRELDDEDLEEMRSKRSYLALQPLTSIHLHSNLRWELESNGNIAFVYLLFATIIFILIICSVNYINLTTARTIERSKEVGVRRILGADKGRVSLQFILEAIVTCVFACMIAWVVSYAFYHQFIELMGVSVPISILGNFKFLGISLLLAILIGLFTGIYPSIIVSRVVPVQILKGKFVNHTQGKNFRRSLVVVQFIVAAIMIFGSVVVYDQIRYMEEKELGFDADQMVVMKMHSSREINRVETLKQRLEEVSGVLKTGAISNLPGSQFDQNSIYLASNPDERVSCSELRVDFDALELLGLELNRGRWFQSGITQDSAGSSFIVNETALSLLNLGEETDENIIWDEEGGERKGKIVGVVKDFHYKSLHKEIRPLIIHVNPEALNYVLIKISGVNPSKTLSQIEEVHDLFDNTFDFDWFFLDQQIHDQYHAERQLLTIFRLFTLIALALSALGLLGLAYLVITQRTQEIGIRRVLGASMKEVLWMENRTFLKAAGLSLVIALPSAFLFMQIWLMRFSYRVSVGFSPIMLTIFAILIITIVSVSLAVWKTVAKNSSVALRYE